MRFAWTLALVALWIGCTPEGTTNPPQCGEDAGTCPAGQACGTDRKCHPVTNMTCTPACSGTTPVCDKSTLTCVACLADTDCPTGTLCVARACMPGCSSARPDCAADAGACDVDLGVCRGCLADAECGGSTPRCDTRTGRCVACVAAQDNCPSGQYCSSAGGTYACVAGCKGKGDCAGDGGTGLADCCDHVCQDVTRDARNCGACGMACASGAACCVGACIDTSKDPQNCGACGNVCTVPGATAACAGGQCTVGKCTGTLLDCNKQPSDGCEIDPTSDPKNCGACAAVCPLPAHTTSATCAAGKCGIGACEPNWGDCDGDASNGCETSLVADVNNCGKCATRCPTSTMGTVSCQAGMCALTCTGNLRDCDGDLTNGCEANITSDAKNCNGCGNQCNVVINGKPACVNSLCAVGACDTGYSDCDKDPINGCEAQLTVDPKNCGACGKVCTATNGVGGCVAGACTLSQCNTGYGNCDGDASNGCETNLNNDSKNCGACGMVCNTGSQCASGTCTTTNATVRDVAGNVLSIVLVPCGNGTASNCTEPVAETSCTSVGRKLVSHASNGTTAVVSLGATSSCYWSIGYFTNNNGAAAGQCLVGVSNAQWTSCCGTSSWHGNTVSIPSVLGQQFGYISSNDTGYNAGLTNTTGTTWGCVTNSTAATARTGCTTYYVACK